MTPTPIDLRRSHDGLEALVRLQWGDELYAGHLFVFLGRRLSGTPNAIIGPLFGLYLLLYAIGIWRMRRYALPMGIGYAVYVVLNLILFTVRDPTAFRNGLLFGLVYSVVAIGVSGGTAYLLAQRRAALT